MFDYTPTRKDMSSAVKWLISLAILAVAILAVVFVLRWVQAPLDVMSPDTIRRLSRQANEHYQSLQAQLASIDTQESRLSEFELTYGIDRAKWPQGRAGEYLQLSAAVSNLRTSYNLSCGRYNALWDDEWRDLPAPDDLPKRCDLIH